MLKVSISRIKPTCSYSSYVLFGKKKSKTPSELHYTDHHRDFANQIYHNYKEDVNFLNNKLQQTDDKRISGFPRRMEERQAVISMIEKKLCTPNSKLIGVGSSSTGLMFDAVSDIDLCLYTSNLSFYEDFQKYANFRSYLFNRIKDVLTELKNDDPGLEIVHSISLPNTYVPIIKFRFKKGLTVDIQVPRTDFQAIRNTNLVKHYISADHRFPKIFIYIKKLFETLGLRNSSEGLVSTYHLTLLIIHFLQCRTMPDPVLPVLCSTIPQRVGPDVPIDTVLKLLDGSLPNYNLDWHSSNHQSAAELIFEMISYYKDFDFISNHIFINRGLVIKKPPYKNTPPKFHLIDPYSPITICRSADIPDVLSTAMKYIHRNLFNGYFIGSYPRFEDGSAGFARYIEGKRWANKLKCIETFYCFETK